MSRLIYNTENVSTLSLIFLRKKSQKAEKSGIKAEWEAECATEKVDQLDTPEEFRKTKSI